jgi:hypothetical protein
MRNHHDFWAWHFDGKEIFSVRLAYQMLVNAKISQENFLEGNAGASNVEVENKGWCTLWQTSILSKVWVFFFSKKGAFITQTSNYTRHL